MHQGGFAFYSFFPFFWETRRHNHTTKNIRGLIETFWPKPADEEMRSGWIGTAKGLRQLPVN